MVQKAELDWAFHLRERDQFGPILHTIRHFTDGHYELDGVLILPEHIKHKLGGDAATEKMYAEKISVR